MAQLHADAVMVLVGLTVGLVALAYALRLPRARSGARPPCCSASNWPRA